MTITQLLQYAREQLENANILNSMNEARYMLEALLKVDRNYLFMHGPETVEDVRCEQYRQWVKKRSTHYPMQYIIGEQPFMDFTFYVDENVLIPRQDTEVLVEEAVKYLSQDMQVLDLCCGSGCIGLSLGRLTGAHVTLADISEGAIAVTKRNAQRLGLQAGIILSDLFEKIEQKYDMIVSNPPYIRSDVIPSLMEEVREYEPMLALDGREDGLYFYRRIVDEARKFLNEDGYLLFEIGYDQGDDLREILVGAGYSEIQVLKDLAGLDRVVTARYAGSK